MNSYAERLLGCLRGSIIGWNDVDDRAAFLTLAKQHLTIEQGVDRVIFADADIAAGVIFRTALTHDDVPRNDGLPAVQLHAQVLWI